MLYSDLFLSLLFYIIYFFFSFTSPSSCTVRFVFGCSFCGTYFSKQFKSTETIRELVQKIWKRFLLLLVACYWFVWKQQQQKLEWKRIHKRYACIWSFISVSLSYSNTVACARVYCAYTHFSIGECVWVRVWDGSPTKVSNTNRSCNMRECVCTCMRAVFLLL